MLQEFTSTNDTTPADSTGPVQLNGGSTTARGLSILWIKNGDIDTGATLETVLAIVQDRIGAALRLDSGAEDVGDWQAIHEDLEDILARISHLEDYSSVTKIEDPVVINPETGLAPDGTSPISGGVTTTGGDTGTDSLSDSNLDPTTSPTDTSDTSTTETTETPS